MLLNRSYVCFYDEFSSCIITPALKKLNETQIIIVIIIHKRELIYRKIKIICLVT